MMNAPSTVLLVEDDDDDAFFFKRALQKTNLPFAVQVAKDGQKAIDYMKGDGEFSDRSRFPFPRFIITDNRMPTTTGYEFLKWLKENRQFHVIPTIVFGGSTSPVDIATAYDDLCVNSYIIKPSSPDQLEKVVKLIFDYWQACAVPATKF